MFLALIIGRWPVAAAAVQQRRAVERQQGEGAAAIGAVKAKTPAGGCSDQRPRDDAGTIGVSVTDTLVG